MKLKITAAILALFSVTNAGATSLDRIDANVLGRDLEIRWSAASSVKSVHLTITNAYGAVVKTMNLPCEITPCSGTTPPLNLEPGIYILRGQSDDMTSEELTEVFNIASGEISEQQSGQLQTSSPPKEVTQPQATVSTTAQFPPVDVKPPEAAGSISTFPGGSSTMPGNSVPTPPATVNAPFSSIPFAGSSPPIESNQPFSKRPMP